MAKSQVFAVRLPQELASKVVQASEVKGVTYNALIAGLIAKHIHSLNRVKPLYTKAGRPRKKIEEEVTQEYNQEEVERARSAIITECALCNYSDQLCYFDGEAYICIDSEKCKERQVYFS